METRRTLGRWVMLAFELAVLKARGHMDSELGREYLETNGHIVSISTDTSRVNSVGA